MAKTITIYSRNQCASCHMVKTWLKTKNLPYTEINLDEQPDLTQYVVNLSRAMTVPVIVVGEQDAPDTEKQVIVGWQPARLTSAIQGVASVSAAA